MEDGDKVALQVLRRSRDLRFSPPDTTLQGLSWYLEVPPLKFIYKIHIEWSVDRVEGRPNP